MKNKKWRSCSKIMFNQKHASFQNVYSNFKQLVALFLCVFVSTSSVSQRVGRNVPHRRWSLSLSSQGVYLCRPLCSPRNSSCRMSPKVGTLAVMMLWRPQTRHPRQWRSTSRHQSQEFSHSANVGDKDVSRRVKSITCYWTCFFSIWDRSHLFRASHIST